MSITLIGLERLSMESKSKEVAETAMNDAWNVLARQDDFHEDLFAQLWTRFVLLILAHIKTLKLNTLWV